MRAVLLLILLLAVPAHAQQSTIIGVGAVPCSEWTEARADAGPKALQLRAWLFGFISGINAGLQTHGDMLVGEGPETFANWVDKFCKQQPARSLAAAANAMATEFVGSAVTAGKLKP